MSLAGGRGGGRVQIKARDGLARNPAALDEAAQRVWHCEGQDPSQFLGEIALGRVLHEGFRGSQQRAVAREPDRVRRPEAVGAEADEFARCVVTAAMRVAGEIVERFQFSKHRHIDLGAESLLEFVPGGDLVREQQLAQGV